jgi:hypothetical protein
MRRVSANLSDLLGAALLISIGALGVALTVELPMRSGPRIGPGAMPLAASVLVTLSGLGLLLRAALVAEPPPTGWRLRPPIAIAAAIVAFAFMLERIGLVAASALLLAVAIAAQTRVRPLETALYIAAVLGVTVLVFKVLLKVPLELWPR